LVAPESATQSVTGMGGADVIEMRQLARDCGSHSLNYDVEGGDCFGGGRANEGPTCCTGKPYWGAVKKACDIDQYGAPPWTGRRRTARQVAPESHTGVPQRRLAALTSTGLCPWTGRRTARRGCQ
jgi:hypothetical protein